MLRLLAWLVNWPGRLAVFCLVVSQYLNIGWLTLGYHFNPESLVVLSVLVIVIWALGPIIDRVASTIIKWIVEGLLMLGVKFHFTIDWCSPWLVFWTWCLLDGLATIKLLGLVGLVGVGEIQTIQLLWMGVVLGLLQHLNKIVRYEEVIYVTQVRM